MQITVSFYGPFRDWVDASEKTFELPKHATIRELRRAIIASIKQNKPDFDEGLMTVSAFAVNEQLVNDEHVLQDNIRAHILPPVNGG